MDPTKEDLVPLNLPLTSTPEFIKLIEFILKRDYPCPHQQQNLVKPKAMNFPISKITIGEWTSTAVYRDDLTAKFYFARKTLMWELFEDEETGVARVKRKIEILWDNVLSFRATFHPHDGTGILQLELANRPTFFLETNPLARTHSIWKQMDQDFTLNQSASKCRRHTLHFSPGVLQKNLGKVVSIDTFWSKLVRVTFPTLPQSLYFDIPYGNNNNKKPRYGQCQTLVTQTRMDGNSQTDSNGSVANEISTYQVGLNLGGYLAEEGETQNMEHAHLDANSQTNSNGSVENEISTYQVGPNLGGYLAEEGETQNMEHTHLDGNSQTDSNGSVPPDL